MQHRHQFLLGLSVLLSGIFLVSPIDAFALTQRRLDGVLVPTGKENQWPIAVMMDNHTSARPQSNLQRASVVYESLAEGGIPRFMAVYTDSSVGTVGPIRYPIRKSPSSCRTKALCPYRASRCGARCETQRASHAKRQAKLCPSYYYEC